MYRCQVTGKLSKLGDTCHKVVAETRAVTYKHWDREAEEEWFTHGTEIVRELTVTEEGERIWNGMTPDQRTAFLKGMN